MAATYFEKVTDVYTRPNRGSLTRQLPVYMPGVFRLARRTAELHSVLVIATGHGQFNVYNGNFELLWCMPSIFTGSWMIGAGCENGLIIEVTMSYPNIQMTWREEDDQAV